MISIGRLLAAGAAAVTVHRLWKKRRNAIHTPEANTALDAQPEGDSLETQAPVLDDVGAMGGAPAAREPRLQ